MVVVSRPTKDIELNCIEWAKVTIYKEFTIWDIELIEQIDWNVAKTIKWLSLLIKDWNLEEEEGKKMEINENSIRNLGQWFITEMWEHLNEVFNYKEDKDKKK